MKPVLVIIPTLMTIIMGISLTMLFGNPKPVASVASEAVTKSGNPKPVASVASEAVTKSATSICKDYKKVRVTSLLGCEEILD